MRSAPPCTVRPPTGSGGWLLVFALAIAEALIVLPSDARADRAAGTRNCPSRALAVEGLLPVCRDHETVNPSNDLLGFARGQVELVNGLRPAAKARRNGGWRRLEQSGATAFRRVTRTQAQLKAKARLCWFPPEIKRIHRLKVRSRRTKGLTPCVSRTAPGPCSAVRSH